MTSLISRITAIFSLRGSTGAPARYSFGKRFALLVAGVVIGTLMGAGFIYSRVLTMDALIMATRQDNERQHLFHLTDFGAHTVISGGGEALLQHHLRELSEAFEQSQALLTDDENRTVKLVIAGLENPARYRTDVAKILSDIKNLHHKYDKNIFLGNARYVNIFHEASLYLLLVALLVPGLAVISGVFLVRDVVSGLRMLVRKIETIENGGDPGNVKIDRQDEIGAIAAAIDTMHAKTKAQEIESAINRQLLIEQQKMGDIMNLAGGIAHEVANPLSILMTNLDDSEPMWSEHCQCGEEERRELQSHFHQMREAVERIEATLREISAFPGEEDESVETIDVNDLVSRIIGMVRLDDRTRHTDFRVSLSQNVPVIIAPSGKVVLVLFSIISLIAEYMHEKNGAVTIDTNVAETGVQLSFTIDLRAGSETSTAPMFTERGRIEIIQRLKEHATIRRILNELDGTASMDSAPMQGCTFIVQLPFSMRQKGEIETSLESQIVK